MISLLDIQHQGLGILQQLVDMYQHDGLGQVAKCYLVGHVSEAALDKRGMEVYLATERHITGTFTFRVVVVVVRLKNCLVLPHTPCTHSCTW